MPRLRRTRSHSRYDFRVRRVDQNRRTFRRPHYHFRKRRVQENVEIQPVASSNSNRNRRYYNHNTTNAGISSIPVSSINKSRRDILIDQLQNNEVHCDLICTDRIENKDPIWSCSDCYQILHLKCVMIWYIKSHIKGVWRCPACQYEKRGKPINYCFCKRTLYPRSKKKTIPHSCNKMCKKSKKNSTVEYNDCLHDICTLRCHPGPCPPCLVKVRRKCKCGKTKIKVECGRSIPILCKKICEKLLYCNIHTCINQCHAGKCEPCNYSTCSEINDLERSSQNTSDNTLSYYNLLYTSVNVFEEDLRRLGIDPEEVLQMRTENYDEDDYDEDYIFELPLVGNDDYDEA